MSTRASIKIFDKMPSPALAVAVNALGLIYRMNRYSSRMRRTLNEWRVLEGLDANALHTYQVSRLRHILKLAATTPYYGRVFREAGFDPDAVTSVEDLRRLPVLEKEDLVRSGNEMIVPGYSGRVVRKRSSGTTGQPVGYTQPSRMAFEQTYAMLYQFYSWHGFLPLGRRATMAGRYMGRKPGGVVVRNWFENQLLLGVHSLSNRSVARYLDALDDFRPDMMQAHPSALLLLKQLSEARELPPPNLPLISFTGESLSEAERGSLRSWLGGATIFGTYGSGENVVAAGECTALNGCHVHPAIGVCELVNIHGLREIVSTSLLNDAMPLIRYRTGDHAESISEAPCECGCGWPRIIGLQGRVDDVIYSSGGTAIAPVVLRTGIAALGSIGSPYSIVERKKPGQYTLLLYCEQGNESPENIATVLTYLKSMLGQDCEVDVQFNPKSDILTERAKHRTIMKEGS